MRNPIELGERIGLTFSAALADPVRRFYAGDQTTLGMCCGRMSTKSTLGCLCIAFEATVRHREHEKHALEGTPITYAVVSPTLRQAGENFRIMCAVLDRMAPLGVRYHARDGEGAIEIVQPHTRCPAVIRILPDDANFARGFAFASFVFDEAGFSANAGDVVRAVTPRLAQFPGARMFALSTPGAPDTWFYSLIEKPGPHVRVVRLPTYLANPRVTIEQCRAMVPNARDFEQEIEARRWGYDGEAILDSSLVHACVDPSLAGHGPRKGVSCVVGADFAQVRDGAAIVVVSTEYREVGSHSPIRHWIVEYAEELRGSKSSPIKVTDWCAKLAAVSRAFGGAKVRCDARAEVEVQAELREKGVPFEIAGMQPSHQDPRWRTLIDAVNGRRLHLPDNPELLRQLCGLNATTLASGQLRVEGRRDDLADALVLAMEGALGIRPSGDLDFEYSRLHFNDSGLHGGEKRWFRRTPSGGRVPCDPPLDDPGFPRWAASMLTHGVNTPSIEAFRKQNPTWDPNEE